jgi:hypothetical protein
MSSSEFLLKIENFFRVKVIKIKKKIYTLKEKKNSLVYHKNILNILETDPESPWIIERLEPYLFLI